MPKEKYKSMKAYYNEKSTQQNRSLAGDLDALGRKAGQPIYQEERVCIYGWQKRSFCYG